MDQAKTDKLSEARKLAQQVLEQYGDNILRLAYSYVRNLADAQDVLQETLLQVMRSHPTFENEQHKKGWLFRVAISKAQNHLRQASRHATDELNENLIAENKEDLSYVWTAVASLPDKYRVVIHLFYYEGFSTAEISEITNQKDSTVRSILFRGRQLLKEQLKEAYDFDERQ